jgi:hypothetical protein
MKVLNNLTDVLNPDVNLGTKTQAIINSLVEEGSPVNAVAATEILTLTGVVIDGETITINNPVKSGVDVYEFLADAAQSKTIDTNIAVNITTKTTQSSGVLTIDTQPTAGDTVKIGAKTFTFVPIGTDTADGEVSIGADLAGAQAALIKAINATDGVNTPHPLVSAAPFSVANVCTITALIGGTSGDEISTTETFTAESNVFAAATLGAGVDCPAADAITALVAAITASDTQGVGATDGAGDTLVLTVDTAGIAGNDIVINENMANATFTGGATKMSGGIDGTVTTGPKVMVDDTYLYTTPVVNTKSGKNWRRVALGNVY